MRIRLAMVSMATWLMVPQLGALAAPEAPALVISEVMQNPSRVFDSRGEWFEVHNPTGSDVDLQGWRLTDDRTDDFVVDSALVVPAGGEVVFARNGTPSLNGGVEVDFVYGTQMLLRNSIDTLNLVAPDGTRVDRVQWDDGRTFPDPDGASMSLLRIGLDNARGASWCSATSVFGRGDLGTPGAPNRCDASPHAGSLLIDEILQNPRAVGDSVGEWFELYNRGDTGISLRGFIIRDEDSDFVSVKADLVVPGGGRVVIGRSTDRSRNGGVNVDLAYGEAMALHNSADELLIIDAQGLLVDRVAWDDGVTFPDPDGASMALLDPDTDNGLGSAWCETTVSRGAADLATPGEPNDCSPPDPSRRVVITEVLQNPRAVGDRAGEWFELHNPTDAPIDLFGWSITDDGRDLENIDEHVVIAPGGYVVLGENGDSSVNGGVALDFVYGDSMVLNNGRDEIEILDEYRRLIDRVAWDDGVAFPDPDGASMSLQDPAADNAAGGVWCVATEIFGGGDFGTPGGPTDCEVSGDYGSVVITEIMQNPAAVGDSVGEWFEIVNDGRSPVDLRGWVIKDEKSESHKIVRNLVVEPGDSIVLGRSADRTVNGGVDVAYAYGSDLRLVNTSDRLTIVDPSGRVVDRVEYDNGVSFPDPSGASMALREPNHDNAEGASWCVSGPYFGAGDRGTPGGRNQCEEKPRHPDVVINEIMQNPAVVFDSLGEWFEVHNRGRQPVDIDGWTIRDDDWDSHVIDNGGPLIVQPDGYLVLARTGVGTNGGAPADYLYGLDLVLYNGADELVLLDRALNVVDDVRWDDGASFPDPEGASMALRPSSPENSLGEDWCVSSVPFGVGDAGSPGSPNTCERPTPVAPCIVCILDPSGTTLEASGGGGLHVTGGSIVVNSEASKAVSVSGGGRISTDRIFGINGGYIAPEGALSPVPTAHEPVPDPLAGLPVPMLTGSPAPKVSISGTADVTLSPGVYSKIQSSSSGQLTLEPGVYVVTDEIRLSKAAADGKTSLWAQGVTVYFACENYPVPCGAGESGAGLSLSGGSSISWTSGDSGPYRGVSVFADRSNTSAFKLTGSSAAMVTGSIYLVSGGVSLSGSSTMELSSPIAVGSLEQSGSSRIVVEYGGHGDGPPGV